jgi:hypothetical protein
MYKAICRIMGSEYRKCGYEDHFSALMQWDRQFADEQRFADTPMRALVRTICGIWMVITS